MIFVPSRKRRESLNRFFELSAPSLPGRVLIDDDDDSYEGMQLPAGWEFFVSKRKSSSARLNEAFKKRPDEPFYGQIGDDYICKPLGWDVLLAEGCGSTRISWGNDGRWGDRLCTSFFIGGDLVRQFGWMAHPELEHLYVDTVWWMVAKGSGTANYLQDVKCTHINVKDQTYRERRISNDHNVFKKLEQKAIGHLIDFAAEIKMLPKQGA